MIREHKKSRQGKKVSRRPEGMRIKMFGYLTIFTMIVLVVIWLLQAVFLDDIYRETKKYEMKIATRKVAAAAGKGQL